jgi:hypothetical protein
MTATQYRHGGGLAKLVSIFHVFRCSGPERRGWLAYRRPCRNEAHSAGFISSHQAMVGAATCRICIDCAFYVCNVALIPESTRKGSEKHAEEPPVSAHRRTCRRNAVRGARELFGNGADGAVGHPNRRDADLPAAAFHARRPRWSTAGSEQPVATSCPTRQSQRHLCRHCGAAGHRRWSVHPKSAGGRLQSSGRFREVRFRGTIAPSGSVQMVYGQDWIFGQFEGATFRGQLDLRGRFGAPGCTYQFSLERVGP